MASQSDTNLEYIVIDGGSTDGTLDIIQQNSVHISHWISEPDKGIYDAMNKGLAMANGTYVLFINSGDKLYTPDTIKEIRAIAIKENIPDVIYGETMVIDENGHEIGARRLKPPDKLAWKHLINGMLVCHQSFIVKRELAPFYDLQYVISADYDWELKCLRRAQSVVNARQYISKYLDNGFSKKNIPLSLKERLRIMIQNYGFIKTISNHFIISLRFFYYVLKNKRY